jgi:AraC-like DNA-binding protein
MALSTTSCRAVPGRGEIGGNALPTRSFGPVSGPELELWRQIARNGHDVIGIGDRIPEVESHVWDLNCMVASQLSLKAQLHKRTSWHIRQRNSGYLRVRIYKRGQSKIQAGNVSHTLGSGNVYLVDHSREFVEISDDAIHLGIYVPHSMVGYYPSMHPQVMAIDIRKPSGYMLRSTICNLFVHLPDMTTLAAPAITEAIAAYIRTYLAGRVPQEAQEAIHACRASAMRRFIDQNLADPNLGIEMLQARFCAARATIYRDFEEYGGVTRYIVSRRLEQAFRQLADKPSCRGGVQAEANRWHFTSADHFSRLFRQKYGCAPSEVAEARERFCKTTARRDHDNGSYADVSAWIARLASASP